MASYAFIFNDEDDNEQARVCYADGALVLKTSSGDDVRVDAVQIGDFGRLLDGSWHVIADIIVN